MIPGINTLFEFLSPRTLKFGSATIVAPNCPNIPPLFLLLGIIPSVILPKI
jgi:hypothetical protein